MCRSSISCATTTSPWTLGEAKQRPQPQLKLVNAVDDRIRMYWHVGRLRNRNDETVMVLAVLDLCMLAKRGP